MVENIISLENVLRKLFKCTISGLLITNLSFIPFLKESIASNSNSVVSTDIIKVGTDDWYPYEYGKEPLGITVDVIEEASRRMGTTIKYDTKIPWARALNNLKDGKYDLILSGSWNLERNNLFYFENLKPITHFIWGAYKFKENNKIELKKIGIIREYFYPLPFKEKFNGLEEQIVNSNESIILMLESGRIDLGLMENNNANELSKKLNVPLILIPNTLYAIPAFPLINKNWESRDLFVKTLNEMHLDGTIYYIHKKWNLRYLGNIPLDGSFLHNLE